MRGRAGLTALITIICVSCAPTARPTLSPLVTDTSAIAPTPSGIAPTPQALVVHDIPKSYTTPLLDVATDGSQIIWSRGTPGSAGGVPYLYRYTLGGPSPSLVYSDPDPTVTISPIAVGGGGYAFVEQFSRGGAAIGWRLFYEPRSGQPAVKVDTSESDPASFNGLIPQITLAGNYLVWTAVHPSGAGAEFFLRAYSIQSGQITTLQSSPASQTEYWFPSADGANRLVYSTVEYSAPGSSPKFHVYLIAKIGASDAQPARLDTDGAATNPVISGDTVAWKTVTGNVNNYGRLVLYSLSTRTAHQVKFANQPFAATPSIGNRYAAVWGMDVSDLELFDCVADQPLTLYKSGPPSPILYVRPVVARDILVFSIGSNNANVDLQLSWMYLPPRP